MAAGRQRKASATDDIPSRVRAIQAAARSSGGIAAACRSAGISVPTYYRWRSLAATPPEAHSPGGPLNRADRKRAKLLESAKDVFLQQGIDASLNDVARAAGVTRQTLYNLFGDRERLFGEVVQSIYLRLAAPVLMPPAGADLVTVLEQTGRHHLRFAIDAEAIGLLRIALGEYRRNPRLTAATYATRSAPGGANMSSVIAARLEQEIRRGAIEPVDPVLAAEAFLGSLAAFVRHRAMIGQPVPPDTELEARLALSIAIFTRGLGYRASRRVTTDRASGGSRSR